MKDVNLSKTDVQKGTSAVSALVVGFCISMGIQFGIKALAHLLTQFANSEALIGVSLFVGIPLGIVIIAKRDKKDGIGFFE